MDTFEIELHVRVYYVQYGSALYRISHSLSNYDDSSVLTYSREIVGDWGRSNFQADL